MSEIEYELDPITGLEAVVGELIRRACPELSSVQSIATVTPVGILDALPPFCYCYWTPAQPSSNEDAIDGGSTQSCWMQFHVSIKFSWEGEQGNHKDAYPIFWKAIMAVVGAVADRYASTPFELVSFGPENETDEWIFYGFDVRTQITIQAERSEYQS